MTDYTGAISTFQSHISDEDDSSEHSPRSTIPTSPGGGGDDFSKTSNMIVTLDHHHHNQTPSSSENTAKKPRGRPPGSKNKPKQPVFITRESDSAMKPVILEISAGSDIIDAIISYARRNHVGISILSVTGSVSNVKLRHPVSQAPAIPLHGPFGLLSLSGSIVASTTLSSSNETSQSSPSSSSPSSSSLSSSLPCSFGVTLAGEQGHVFGGIVGGNVMAATPVIVVATTFVNPVFHKLPCEGDNGVHHQKIHPFIPGHNIGRGGDVGTTESGGMSMAVYGVACSTPPNHQISPDAMPWGPSSRPF